MKKVCSICETFPMTTETNGYPICNACLEELQNSMYPTRGELIEYLDLVNRLSNFEAEQRNIRGWGAFTEKEVENFPNPTILKINKWLKSLSEQGPF